jgi:AcrR family transcriptional regulator
MIYAHFGSKEDLWLAVLEGAYANKREEERALDVANVPPRDAMERLVRFNIRYTAAHPEFVSLLNQENLHRGAHLARSRKVHALYTPLLDTLREVLERGVAAGEFRAGVDPMQLYITIVAVGHFYVANHYTLSNIFGVGVMKTAALVEREHHCVEVVLGYLRP